MPESDISSTLKGVTAEMKRRFIDENGRLFGTISIVDLIVIIIAIALIGAIYAKFHVLEKTSSTVPTTNITYQVKVSAVRGSAFDTILEGDTVYSSTGIELGTIKSISLKPAERSTPLADGTLVLSPIENRNDAYLTVESPATVSTGRYYINRTFELNVNRELPLLTKYNSFSGVIISLGESVG